MYKRVENLVEETSIKNVDPIAMEYFLMVAQAKKPDEIMEFMDSGKATIATTKEIV
jgi:hypothetical protein